MGLPVERKETEKGGKLDLNESILFYRFIFGIVYFP